MLKKFIIFLTLIFLCEGKPYPICFSISESKTVNIVPEKDKDFATIIPGNLSTYVFNEEEDYYKDYQRSYYAITTKKAGWDCMRHYEILANGCVPYFIDLTSCPVDTMHLLPRALIIKAMNLPGVSNGTIDHALFDKARYYEIAQELLEYTKKYLSTQSVSQYILDAIGYSGTGKILYLCNDTRPDYLVACVLTGLKQISPTNIIDFPKLDYIYTDYPHDAKNLYGKGFSYSKILDDIEIDRDNIEERIKNREFEFVIFPQVHWGCRLHELVTQYYADEKIVYLDGEDCHNNCPFANYHNFFLREADSIN